MRLLRATEMKDAITLQPKVPPSRENFVYGILREAILSGELKPDDTINQADVAGRLGVSSIPVRAAIGRLLAEGLITQEPHHSPKVSALSFDALEEILAIRMHLEVLATELAVPRIESEGLASLAPLIDEMGAALEAGELYRFGSLNKEFHLAICQFCPYPLLRQMIKDLWDKADIQRSRTIFVLVPGLAKTSHQEHLELVKCIEKKQAKAAAHLLRRHKTRARLMLVDATVDRPPTPEAGEARGLGPRSSGSTMGSSP